MAQTFNRRRIALKRMNASPGVKHDPRQGADVGPGVNGTGHAMPGEDLADNIGCE